MPFEIPADLNPALMGVAWLIGTWQGNGHGHWPADEPDAAAAAAEATVADVEGDRPRPEGDFTYGQRIDFTTNGGPFLHYHSQLFTLTEDGAPDRPLLTESGYWRPHPDASLEVLLASPEGWSEVWLGTITPGKIEMVTDAVMRTTTADVPYTGGHRLYGNVEGDLLWTFDRATTAHELQPYLWARLQRVQH